MSKPFGVRAAALGRRAAGWVCRVAIAVVFAGLLAPLGGSTRVVASSSCVSEAPDATAAAAVAKACGTRVEIVPGRSEYTQVFANPDGTSTFSATAVPARVHRVDGSWAGVDTTLVARADGSLAAVATSADVVLSGGGSGPFVTYRQGGSSLTLSWPTMLPTPSLDGDTAVYAEVLAGVDLRVTATATGFRHVLVVKTAAAAANTALTSIRYQVGGSAVATTTPDGRVRFADQAGHLVALTWAPSMWDSTVNPGASGEVVAGVDPAVLRSAPPAELVSTEDGPGATAVSARLGVRSGAGNGLVLTPDAALLRGSSTVFPVFIDPQIGAQRTKWAYANSINSNWDVAGQAWVGMNPFDGTLYRSFFDFPTTYGGQTYKGKHVLAASFSIELDHSWSCTDTYLHLYRTSAINVANGARMSWSTRPLGSGAKWLDSAAAHANEAGGCGVIQPDMLMTFGNTETMRADVQAAATANWNTYTVGMCACNASGLYESTQDRWKRFYVDLRTTMSVTFNTVPGPPANLSPHQGQVACGGTVGTASPVLRAQYVDADSGDTLSATFHWQQLPSGTVTSVAGTTAPANNYGTAALALGAGSEGTSYQFQVQTYDGHDYSAWSPWCGFTVVTTAPPAPVVTAVVSGSAPVYAACDPANISTCVSNGGPGVAGAFTLSEPAGPAGQTVVKYVYGWESPSVQVTVALGASYGPVLVTPPRYGINTLAVYSMDGSGRQSSTTAYKFLVGAPSTPLANWPLDSFGGNNFTDTVSGLSLTTTGVTWTPDVRYLGTSTLPANAATFSSVGEATQSVTAFDTSGSFSVAASVRLASTTCSGNQTAVSVDGDSVTANSHVSGLFLSFDCTSGKWRLRVPDQNVAQPTIVDAWASTAAVAGRWTFLVGVWDENEQKVRLYVNGTLTQEVTPTATWLTSHGAGWKATGAVAIGRDRWNNTNGGHFVGEIGEARLWNRVITLDDIAGTNADPATGVPAQSGLALPRQVGSWAFPDGECYCTDSGDGAYFGRRLFLDSGWTGDPATSPSWLTADSQDGDGAVQLNGASGYAWTTDPADGIARPVLRTDQSLTVAAWAKLTAVTGVEQTVVKQGDTNSAMKLYLDPSGKWAFSIANPNGSGGVTYVSAVSDAPAVADGSWVHLVGVFDVASGQTRLYVNGVLQAIKGAGAVGWNSTGSLMIGATTTTGGFFGGVIDHVGVWQGVLNDREITNLYATGAVQ